MPHIKHNQIFYELHLLDDNHKLVETVDDRWTDIEKAFAARDRFNSSGNALHASVVANRQRKTVNWPTLAVTINRDGRISLWDEPESAMAQDDEIAFALSLTFEQQRVVEEALRRAELLPPPQTLAEIADDCEAAIDKEACPGCGCQPGDGVTAGCYDPRGCGFFKSNR